MVSSSFRVAPSSSSLSSASVTSGCVVVVSIDTCFSSSDILPVSVADKTTPTWNNHGIEFSVITVELEPYGRPIKYEGLIRIFVNLARTLPEIEPLDSNGNSLCHSPTT